MIRNLRNESDFNRCSSRQREFKQRHGEMKAPMSLSSRKQMVGWEEGTQVEFDMMICS